MAAEQHDADQIAQRRWEIERQRHRFRAALLIVFLLLTMYFVVAPLSAAYGKPLELPRIELVMIFMALVSFPAFGVQFGAAGVMRSLANRINISVAPTPKGGDSDGNAAD
jgi:hypothetical protein